MAAYTVNGTQIQSITLKMPRWGVWTARCKLAGDKVLLAGTSVVVVLGDLTLTGVVRHGGVFISSAEYVIVGGKDGWSKTIGRKNYRTDAGVQLSTVVSDLVKDSGEPIRLMPGVDQSLGYAWSRPAGVASQALDLLAPHWWVAPGGTTCIGERAETVLPKTVKWSLESYDPANKIAVIGVSNDTVAAFQPGVRLTASGMDIVAGSVIVTVTDRKAVIEVWGV